MSRSPIGPTGTRRAPDGARPDGPASRVGVMSGFRRVVDRLGGDHRVLLAEFGLAPDALDDPDAWLPFVTAVDLLERAAEVLDRPDLGLELAEHQGLLAALGPAAFIARHSETVESTLRALGGWLDAVQTRGVSFEVDRTDEGSGRLRWRIRLPLRAGAAQTNELNHAICLRILQNLRGRDFRPLEVRFVHEQPRSDARLRQLFGPRLRFGAAYNEIRIAAADMDAPNPQSDPALRELAQGYVGRLVRARGRPADTVSRCADLVAQLLPTRGCDLAAVAAALELHPRTLQRRLRAAGTDFRSVVERERRTFALRYLADPELPLVRISGRLGYADQPTFTRACGIWFGHSPAVMRERLLTGEYPGADEAP